MGTFIIKRPTRTCSNESPGYRRNPVLFLGDQFGYNSIENIFLFHDVYLQEYVIGCELEAIF